VTTGGGRAALHSERRGHGPRIVALHGWAMNMRAFDALGGALEQDFEFVTLDLPGHGRSREDAVHADGWQGERIAADVLAALDALGPTREPATLLGWSLGGQVALQLAAAAPARFARLVLVATTPRFVADASWPHGLAPAALAGFATGLLRDHRATLRDFLELQLRGSRNAAAALALLEGGMAAHGAPQPEALQRAFALLGAADLRALLPTIRMPTLAIAGEYDRVTAPAAVRALAAALPDAQYREFARCGHAPFVSQVGEFAAQLREFIARR
jgi:pimeloyl-[acyl-carrier protein] methyl ester esterase